MLAEWLATEAAVDEGALLVEQRDGPGGRGLYAKADIAPNTRLLDLPARLMLNKFTLKNHFPGKGHDMTSTQMTCFYLAHPELNDFWRPFLDSIPKSFDEHPLIWALEPDGSFGNSLLSMLPLHIRQAVLRMRDERFEKDLRIMKKYEVSMPLKPVDDTECARAWLNVNTRCIFLAVEIGTAIDENLTLVPFVDFANHTADHTRSCQFSVSYKNKRDRDSAGQPVEPDSATLWSPPVPIAKDEEIYLEYGQHANSYLMEEYGFVLPRKAPSDPGVVTLDAYLEPLITQAHPACKDMLDRWGYWGDWKLHTFPEAAPSYRTLVVCRLLHLPSQSLQAIMDDPDSSTWDPNLPAEPYADDSYARWKACVLGYVDHVSAYNEQQTRQTISTLCTRIAEDALAGMDRVHARFNETAQATDAPVPSWVPFSVQCIKHLWQEHFDVALAVRSSIDAGAEF